MVPVVQRQPNRFGFEVSPTDFPTLSAVAAAVIAVAGPPALSTGAGVWLTHTDPKFALRHE